MSTEICFHGNNENAHAVKYFLQQMTAQTDSEIVGDLLRSGNAPNWTNYPDIWSNEIQKIKWSLQESIYRSNTATEVIYCVINNSIWKFLPPIILSLGTFGNFLSFVVLWNFSGKTVSTFVYLSLLALTDQLVLIFGLLRRWINHLIAQKLEDNGTSLCKISQLLGNTLSVLSVWLIVAVTLERAIVITFPFKAPSMVKKQRAYVVSSVLAVIILLVHSHFLFSVDLVNGPSILESSVNVTVCKFKTKFKNFVSYWLIIDATVYSFLPLICILMFNIIILVKIGRAVKNRRSLTTSNSRKHNTIGSESTRQPTIMLLLISGTFIVTTTPIFIVKIFTLFPRLLQRNHLHHADLSVKEIAAYQLADSVAELLMHINHAMNFYLYCASGNKFRLCLKSLCKRWLNCTCWFTSRDMEPSQGSLFTQQNPQCRNVPHDARCKNSIGECKKPRDDQHFRIDNKCERMNAEELI